MDRSKLFDYSDGSDYEGKPVEQVFTEIEKANIWKSTESVSGHGSTLSQAKTIIEKIPVIIKELDIKSIFDIPCGDFNWFKEIDLNDINYIGGDIVQSIISSNNNKYSSDNVTFVHFNLLEDIPEPMDLIFCRDCLVHFSNSDIFKALTNILQSGATYFMTTTFPGEETNKDIVTGGWRPVNFQNAPFNFPEPKIILNENCTEKDGAFADKWLALWELNDLKNLKLEDG